MSPLTLLELDDGSNHDERLATEIVRLRQELEQTVQQGQEFSDESAEIDTTQKPSDSLQQQPRSGKMNHAVDETLSPQRNLIRTTSQTEYVDTSACYKYAESDDDGSANDMLSYDEVTVDTTDEQFLFMVEDEVTVMEEEEVNEGEAGAKSQQPQSQLPVKRVNSLHEHLLSHSQHSTRSPSKYKQTMNPYGRYTMNDDNSEKSDNIDDNDINGDNNEIILEEEDNQSCLSYDEITVTTADLVAEMEYEQHQPFHPKYSNSNSSVLNLSTSSTALVSTLNDSNENPDQVEVGGDLVDEDDVIASLLVSPDSNFDIHSASYTAADVTHNISNSISAKDCVLNDGLIKDVLDDDIILNINQNDFGQTSVTPEEALALVPTSKYETEDIYHPIEPLVDTEWTNFNQHLIDVTTNRTDEQDSFNIDGDVQTKLLESSLTNTADSKHQDSNNVTATNNASISQNLSIDEQIRLMQAEMLMSSPIKTVPNKVTHDSTVQHHGLTPMVTPLVAARTNIHKNGIVLSPKLIQKPVSTVTSPNVIKSPMKAKSPTPDVTPRRQHPKSPMKSQSPLLHDGDPVVPRSIPISPTMSLTSTKTSVEQTLRSPNVQRQQSPKPRHNTEPVQKQQSPIKLEHLPPDSQFFTPSSQQFPKSPPTAPLSSLVPLNALLSPDQAIRPPKSKIQQSPSRRSNSSNLPPTEHQYVSPTSESFQQNYDNPESNVTNEVINTKKKKTKLVRKIRKKTVGMGDGGIGPESSVVDQEALDLQAQIDEMKAQIALATSALPPSEGSPMNKSPTSAANGNRPPPMFNLLGAIETAATKRVKRLEETGGELLMQDVIPEVDVNSTKNPQLSTSMAEMISQRATARDKRLADGGEQRMRKVVIKEKDEYKKDFSSIVGDAAAMGRLTRLDEYTVEAVGQPKKPQEEWKSNGLLAIQWRSAHMSVIHDAAAAGNATKMPEHTVSNFQEENRQDDSTDKSSAGSSARMEKLTLLDVKVGEGLRKIDDFLHGQKEHQGKVNSLLIKPMQAYSKIEDVKLPRQSAPKIDPARNAAKLSKMKRDALMSGRPMIDISASAAERAWERRARLDRPGTAPNVREACQCDYCASASPYQTFAYRELDRKRKEEGWVDPNNSRKKMNADLHCINHQDAKSIDSDMAQVKTKEEEDEIEMKRLERQRVREERRRLKQAVADAEVAIAKVAADAEAAAALKKQLEQQPDDDDAGRPTPLFNETKKAPPIESAPASTPYSLVKERTDEWNNNKTVSPTNAKYKNPPPPTVDSAKCTCTIM